MKRLFTIIFFITVASTYTYAQSIYDIRDAMDFFNQNKILTGENNNMLSESDIQGSPFLNDEFILGTIYTKQKLQYNNIPLRYNIYNDDLEFRTPENETLALSAPEIVEKAQFGEYTLSYIPYQNVKKMKRGFFQILVEGNLSLYARSAVAFQAATEPAAYKDAQPAKFVDKPNTYYIRIGEEAAQKVGNKKELIALLSDHEKEVTAFIKKNKIKLTKSEGLKKLITFYNSL